MLGRLPRWQEPFWILFLFDDLGQAQSHLCMKSSTLADLQVLKDLVQGVPPIACVGAHLSWPAAGLPRLCPFGTDKDVRTIDLIDGAVTRPLVWDVPLTATNAQGEGLSLDACGGMYSRNVE